VTTGVAWLDATLLGIGVLSVIFSAVFAVVRTLRPLVHRVGQFLDDWNGEPARPGIAPAKPGVMEQLTAHASRLAAIEHELHPNGGSSMRDAIDRLEAQAAQPAAAPGAVVHIHSPEPAAPPPAEH
jgi:hypothetical protein